MSTEMRPEQGIAGKFVRSALDENGVLSKIEFTNSEKFNFAYDVMDALADKEPDQTALIYVSKDRTVLSISHRTMAETGRIISIQ